MMISVVFAAALGLLAEAVPAAPPAPAPVANPVEAKPKLVCKRETPLGSRVPVKVCRTPQQIAQEKIDQQDLERNLRTLALPPAPTPR